MIRWMNSSLRGAPCDDMVVLECMASADGSCRCLEGCYGEVLKDWVFHLGSADEGCVLPPLTVMSLPQRACKTNGYWYLEWVESESALKERGTASNSNRSTPACSPVLRKRSRSPTPQSPEGENMVEKGSDHSSDKSPSTPEQVVQRTYSLQSARSGGKNSKVSGRSSVHTTNSSANT
ncbi:unnamed protein product [Boreogadus saida]